MSHKKGRQPLIPPIRGKTPEEALRAFMGVDGEKVMEKEKEKRDSAKRRVTMADERKGRQVQSMMESMAPEAARLVLEAYIGGTTKEVDEDLAGAMRTAIDKLPTGKVRREDDTRMVNGLTWLLGDLPEEHPERRALRDAIEDLRQRT